MSMHSDPTAVMGRRIGAVLIDGAVIYVPLWIYVGAQFEYLEQGTASRAQDYCDAFNDRIDEGACVALDDRAYFDTNFGDHLADLSAVGLLLAFLVYVVLQSITGASIGKLLTGLRVVDEEGRKASFGRVLVRWLMWIIDGIPFLLGPLVGLITAATTNGHRRVGDMVAKTHVVHRSAVGRPPAALGLGAPAPWATGAPAPTARPGPQWDDARGTYIQWDPEATEWMQWDEPNQRWNPIPPAPAIPPPPVASPPPPPPPPPSGGAAPPPPPPPS